MVDGITYAMDMGPSKLWEIMVREGWRVAVHGVEKGRT